MDTDLMNIEYRDGYLKLKFWEGSLQHFPIEINSKKDETSWLTLEQFSQLYNFVVSVKSELIRMNIKGH